jgi:hypothetical protein
MKRVHISGGEAGGALLIAIIATIVLAGMTTAMLSLSTASQKESLAAANRVQALYVAEAGMSRAIGELEAGLPKNAFGSAGNPVAFGAGGFWGSSTDNGDNTQTIQAFGTAAGATRGVECVMVAQISPIYGNALFAGNSSGDPTYTLGLGGCGSQADFIDGPVYSGNDVELKCDSTVTGPIRAQGTITGAAGTENISQPVPDIPGMQYASNHDYDVANVFASNGVWQSASVGGSAYQVPEDNPCHIFRKNPSDRTTETSGTSKDDYFLEDPYEAVNKSSIIDPTAGAYITLSGSGGKPGPDGNEKVYYIDGNLWIHSKPMYSFTLHNSAPDGVRVTVVVNGNIYVSDNIFYDDPQSSGLALIAIKDAKEPDSGNIYFGDPRYGTLEHMSSFMYAENDFYDNNLSASGSAKVTVHGNMTAGNQVNINRDYNGQHSKLTVDFDQRILNKALTLPGLPTQSSKVDGWTLSAWREIAVP